jgi:hypothetical protein
MFLKKLAAIAICALTATTATAIPVKWETDTSTGFWLVTNGIVTEVAQKRITGSFVYDADLDQFSDIDLHVETFFPVLNYAPDYQDQFSPYQGSQVSFSSEPVSADMTGASLLVLQTFATQLTNAGGSLTNYYWVSRLCLDASCGYYSQNIGQVLTGSYLTGTPVVASVPLPAGLPLLLAGLGGLGVLRRKRRHL